MLYELTQFLLSDEPNKNITGILIFIYQEEESNRYGQIVIVEESSHNSTCVCEVYLLSCKYDISEQTDSSVRLADSSRLRI